jgi:HD-like signal output (HDOD) protein
LRAAVSALGALPCRPAALDRLHAAADPAAGPGSVVEALESDVGLAVKVLQLVNSSFFAPAARITSLAEAAGRLGPAVLQSLADELRRVPPPADGDAARIDRLAAHALAAARRSRDSVPDGPGPADDAFCAGLLHVVGPLAVLGGSGPLDSDDRREADVAGIGAYLLHLWGLPTEVIGAATRQHQECPECAA